MAHKEHNKIVRMLMEWAKAWVLIPLEEQWESFIN